VDLFHFSHDPMIERFVPHVPATNPGWLPLIWEIAMTVRWIPPRSETVWTGCHAPPAYTLAMARWEIEDGDQ